MASYINMTAVGISDTDHCNLIYTTTSLQKQQIIDSVLRLLLATTTVQRNGKAPQSSILGQFIPS